MDLFENVEQIKERILNSLDKITDDKKVIYDQIKRLETENYVIDNNIEYFEVYLNYLEYKKAINQSITFSSDTENKNDKGNNIDVVNPKNNCDANYEIKFEDFLNMKRN